MKEKDYRILKQFAENVRRQFPDAEIWGYGSRVRGDASELSDLDVCIVVKCLDDVIDKTIMNIAWESGFENDIIISTVTFEKNDFSEGVASHSPFVKSILSYGIAA